MTADDDGDDEEENSAQPPPPDPSLDELLQLYDVPVEFMLTILRERQQELLHRLLLVWRKFYRSAPSHAYI